MTNMQPRNLFRIALTFAMIVGTAAVVRAATATWDPNTEPDLAGYKLSYGTQSGQHPNVIDVGKVTTYPFNPPPGRYYVVVQAYNTSGELSDKSAEVVVDIAGANQQPLPPPIGSQPPPVGNQPPPSGGPPTSAPGPPPASLPNPTQPITLLQPSHQTSALDRSVALTLVVGNLHGRALSFNATGLPPGLSISGAGVISGIPTTIGQYQVTVMVSDGSATVSGNFTWSIVGTLPPDLNRPNHPPAMDQPENQKSPLDWSVSYRVGAFDPEGAPMMFIATGLPPGLSIDSSSGIISGTTTALGSYQVTVTVSDGEKSTVRHFNWSVVQVRSNGTADKESDSAARATAASATASSATALPAGEDYVDVPGDFDGDGRPDLATYRRSSSEWRIWTSGFNFARPTVMVWGEAGDRPVAADYNGDGVTDFGVYRPSTGAWHLSLSGTQTALTLQWGGPEDVAVPLDHDGDGKADLALIRNGGYDILLSSANYLKSVQVR